MRYRIPALAGLLVAVLLMAQGASAQDVYVRNKPFPQHVNIAGTTYVPLESLLMALRMDWTLTETELQVRNGSGQGTPVDRVDLTIRKADRVAEVQGLQRGEAIWVPLRPTAEVLGARVSYNEQLGFLDVTVGREISEADREAEQQVAADREARDKAKQEAWEKRREQIRAERQAREEAEAAAAEAEAAEGATAEGAPPAGGGEGTFPAEMAGDAKPKAPARKPAAAKEPAAEPEADKTTAAKTEPEAATPEAASGNTGSAEKAEEKPKPDPEAKLIVLRPNAVPDYFTGKVTITAQVKNNGYADAKNVTAYVTVKGPDGSVWTTTRLRQDSVAVDGTWNLSTEWVHTAGTSMPRGVPTVTVDLDYDKK